MNKKVIIKIILGLILLVFFVLGINAYLKEHKKQYPVTVVLNSSDIPTSYAGCIKSSGYTTEIECNFEFMLDEKFSDLCKNSGNLLPPNPPDPVTCRLTYFNQNAILPINYNDCVKKIHSSYELVKPHNRPYNKVCSFEIRKDKNAMNPEIRDLLFNKCAKHPQADKASLSKNYCSVVLGGM